MPGENPPLCLILCAEKARLKSTPREGLHNKVLTDEYQTVLTDEKMLADELDKSRRELEARRIARGGAVKGSG